MHHDRFLTFFFFVFLLLGCVLPVAGEEDLLPPDQAFRISGQADGPDAVRVIWDIADGYYLYRDKIRFRTDTLNTDLEEPDFPEARIKHDEFFGDVPVYRGRVEVRLPLQRGSDAPQLLSLEAGSQGCADRGVCYPPHRQNLLLELSPVAAAEPQPVVVEPPEPEPTSSALDALAGLGRSLGFAADDEILDPEEAYQFTATVEDPQHLRLIWTIADGTYLYKEKLGLALEGADGITLGDYTLPPAEVKKDSVRPDGSIGDIEVYHDAINLSLPLRRSSPAAAELTLVARYQGCAERGICYPPITKKIPLKLAAADPADLEQAPAAVPASPPTLQSPAVSEQDRIAETLRAGDTWLIIATFFGFGLLLAFTPCIFPMIPILSGIIAGQGAAITPRRAFVLSLVYVLAMALTYTLAGVLAGLFGQNLQAAFQNPWILSAFALVFVALAFSMFGFFELQLPASLQGRLTEISNQQQGGTLLGVAVMGLLSALIVGPCVAPPLAGALIFIGQTGDWALGGMALFALSMGMGAPLIAIGTSAGKLLPRAGAWMDTVKAVFGVALLAVAIVLLERILPPAVAMVLWGALLVCSAVYLGAMRDLPIEATGWARLWKGLGVVLLIYGALMLVGAAAGGKDTLQPLRGLVMAGGGAEQAHLQFKRIKTLADLEREVAAASAAGRPAMLDFYADWCVSCKEMERYTFSDPGVVAALRGVTLLQADVTTNDADDQALLQGHFGLPGPPAIIFYGADGSERRAHRVVGFMPAQQFAEHVRTAVK